jgi:hypothetical protein
MPVPTIHHPELGELFLGKKPASPYRGISYSNDIRPGLVASGALPSNLAVKIAGTFGHGGDLKNWGGHGNMPCDDNSIPQADAAYQGAGDCAEAAVANKIIEDALDTGLPQPKITCATVIGWYSSQSGYDPVTGANDNGSDLQSVLEAWQTGFADTTGTNHQILEWMTIEPGNWDHMLEVDYLLEAVYPGYVITQANEDAFSQGKPWDYVPGSPELGGHCPLVVGKPSAPQGGLLTWTRLVPFTQAFHVNQNDEAHGVVTAGQFKRVTGKDAEGYNQSQLEEFFTLLAQQKAAA